MMRYAFMKGDQVRLKSGGPVMVVDDLTPVGVCCIWFDQRQRRRSGVFDAAILERVQ